MTVTIPVGFGQAQYRFAVTGIAREMIVTYSYDPGALNPTAHAATLDSTIRASSRPAQATAMCTGWSYLGVRVTEMDDTGPLSGEASTLVVGTNSGNPMTPNVAVLVRKSTALGGRRNRGRSFIPPTFPGEENVGPSGTIAAPQLSSLNTWWQGLYADLATAGLPAVILHSQVPFTPTPVTGVIVMGTVATQRRRLRRQ